MAWTPPDWFTRTRIGGWLTAWISGLGDVWDRIVAWWSRSSLRREGKMFKIGVVGDLSLQDPQRLWRCLSAACASCDIVVQVGDCHPGYEQMKQAKALMMHRVHSFPHPEFAGLGFEAVPGNHDIDWDAKLGWPRWWRHSYQGPESASIKSLNASKPAFHLVGLDNSADEFKPPTWELLSNVPADGAPLLIFVHKPLSTIVLQDGSESNHIMGEGQPNADAERLKQWCAKAAVSADGWEREVLLIHGHYHSWSYMLTKYAPCLIEGRGGAAGTGSGEIGWTQIIITPEGLTLHKVDL